MGKIGAVCRTKGVQWLGRDSKNTFGRFSHQEYRAAPFLVWKKTSEDDTLGIQGGLYQILHIFKPWNCCRRKIGLGGPGLKKSIIHEGISNRRRRWPRLGRLWEQTFVVKKWKPFQSSWSWEIRLSWKADTKYTAEGVKEAGGGKDSWHVPVVKANKSQRLTKRASRWTEAKSQQGLWVPREEDGWVRRRGCLGTASHR